MSVVSDDRWTCPRCTETVIFWSRDPEMLRLQRIKAQDIHSRLHADEIRRKKRGRRAS